MEATLEHSLQRMDEAIRDSGENLTRREELVLRLVCALIATKTWPDSPSFYGQRIEDRNATVLLAGLWADAIIAEAATPFTSSGPSAMDHGA